MNPCASAPCIPERQQDISESQDIENYLEEITMQRLDILSEYNFFKSMETIEPVPLYGFEMILPFPSGIMKELVEVTKQEDGFVDRAWV